MTVTLNIANDAELRNYIKDMIKGQVMAIARDTIQEVLKEILQKKVEEKIPNSIEHLIKSEISNLVQIQLKNKGWGDPTYIQKVARDLVNEEIKSYFSNKYQPIV